ncbi:hypothetical protein Ddye_014187, partial [Dipteronia dyeriana]
METVHVSSTIAFLKGRRAPWKHHRLSQGPKRVPLRLHTNAPPGDEAAWTTPHTSNKSKTQLCL